MLIRWQKTVSEFYSLVATFTKIDFSIKYYNM